MGNKDRGERQVCDDLKFRRERLRDFRSIQTVLARWCRPHGVRTCGCLACQASLLLKTAHSQADQNLRTEEANLRAEA